SSVVKSKLVKPKASKCCSLSEAVPEATLLARLLKPPT
ncbi:hypothetical protein A2U01_0096326, partial [Trifolium medium]|nr:hypothetical protein [Trifolium medium]